MQKQALSAAISKYEQSYIDGKTKQEIIKTLTDDVFSKADAEEIYSAIHEKYFKAPEKRKGKATQDEIAEKQRNHEHYKWFDEFECQIIKKQSFNAYVNKPETIIVGWSLRAKKNKKFIEPSIAVELNKYANGYDVAGFGNLLLPIDTFQAGSVLSYEAWARMLGKDDKDLKNDINYLLKDN